MNKHLTLALLPLVIALSACVPGEPNQNLQISASHQNASSDSVNPKPELPATTVAFNSISHDFGKVREGEIVTHKYLFRNTGMHPLKIEDVKKECGCTSPNWTKEEIAPGGEGFITLEFNSAGKEGPQNKGANVIMNTPERNVRLFFTCEVVK